MPVSESSPVIPVPLFPNLNTLRRLGAFLSLRSIVMSHTELHRYRNDQFSLVTSTKLMNTSSRLRERRPGCTDYNAIPWANFQNLGRILLFFEYGGIIKV